MSIEKPANERLELYNRFKESLRDGSAESEFFDADDLIIIIDQAVDLDDEYVQIEALMRGYRFFPDNEELATRRAFLYYDLNLDAGVSNMIDRRRDSGAEKGPMWNILQLRMREEDISDAEAESLLEQVLKTPGKFDDETVIQLVDCASACGRYDWLKANEKRLRAKTDYAPTLLYELFIVADLQHDSDYAVRLLEELTEIEPFNIDFWNALAQTQSNAGDTEGALASLDYALAIESDNVPALTLKATILIRDGRNEDALEILKPLAVSEPSALVAELTVRALFGDGQQTAASVVLGKSCREYADDRSLMELALFLNVPELHELLDMHYDATAAADDDKQPWTDWAREHYVSGHLPACTAILACLRRNADLDYNGYKMLATALYCGEQYKDSVALLEDALASRNGAYLMPDIVAGGLMSLLRSSSKAAVKKMLKRVVDAMPMSIKEDWTLSSAIESIGFGNFISILSTSIDHLNKNDIDDLDFFRFPANYSDQI